MEKKKSWNVLDRLGDGNDLGKLLACDGVVGSHRLHFGDLIARLHQTARDAMSYSCTKNT
jgi:hypothetical protein